MKPMKETKTVQTLTEVDFKSGKITFSAPFVDVSSPYTEQLEVLSEDLIQVTYGENCILDVGWYPECDENGSLVIQVIKDKDWSSPIFRKSSKKRDPFFCNLATAIDIAERIK